MKVARSAVSAALFSVLSNAYAWVTADQRLQVPDDLGAFAQPAMFLVKPKETVGENESFLLPIYRLKYFVFICFRASATPEDVPAETISDDILDAIDLAMMPHTGAFQTLGDLVTNAWIDGEIFIDTPVLFEQCAIGIPITVLVGSATSQ